MVPQSKNVRRERDRNEKLLRPVRPNSGLEAAYRRKLDGLIKEMSDSAEYWLTASYRANPPELAADGTPADALRRSIKGLAARWFKRFDAAAPKLAAWFAQATEKRSSSALKKILKDGGFTVEFQMTPAMRDVLDATVNANVAMIKSIPAQYLTEVETMVMRSVQTGRDLGSLTKELEARFSVTRRRAALIAKTQNNMATASMTRARNLEIGLTEAIWVHSHGGREPRPSHVKAGAEKVRYDIAKGWYDPAIGEFIQPGALIGCRCVGRPVVKGFS
jgi:uncharacterized protein with gpF-like domain